MLKVLMRGMDSRMAAVVVQYVPSSLASQLLLQMAPAMRQQVVKHMSRVVQLQEKDVKAIEHDVRKRIEYLMGGEEKLASILESAPTRLQEEVLKTVADEDQKLSARLSHRMILIEDIALLESNELKILTRRIPVQSLAAVLKSSEGLRTQLLPKLTGGLAAWLSQEIELSRELPPDALVQEQKKVVAAMTQLVHEGKITFKKAASQDEAPESAGAESESVQVLDLGLTAPAPQAPAAAAAAQPPVIHVSVAAPQEARPPERDRPPIAEEAAPPQTAAAPEPPAKRRGGGKAPIEEPADPLDMASMPPDLGLPELGDLPGESPSGSGAFDFLDLPEPPSEGTS
jgi:hypothetical protein